MGIEGEEGYSGSSNRGLKIFGLVLVIVLIFAGIIIWIIYSSTQSEPEESSVDPLLKWGKCVSMCPYETISIPKGSNYSGLINIAADSKVRIFNDYCFEYCNIKYITSASLTGKGAEYSDVTTRVRTCLNSMLKIKSVDEFNDDYKNCFDEIFEKYKDTPELLTVDANFPATNIKLESIKCNGDSVILNVANIQSEKPISEFKAIIIDEDMMSHIIELGDAPKVGETKAYNVASTGFKVSHVSLMFTIKDYYGNMTGRFSLDKDALSC